MRLLLILLLALAACVVISEAGKPRRRPKPPLKGDYNRPGRRRHRHSGESQH